MMEIGGVFYINSRDDNSHIPQYNTLACVRILSSCAYIFYPDDKLSFLVLHHRENDIKNYLLSWLKKDN